MSKLLGRIKGARRAGRERLPRGDARRLPRHQHHRAGRLARSESGTAFEAPATANCVLDARAAVFLPGWKGRDRVRKPARFCWGAYGVVKLSSLGKLTAGVSCHPSLKVGQMFLGESEEDQVKTVKCPQMTVSAAQRPRPLQGRDAQGARRGDGQRVRHPRVQGDEAPAHDAARGDASDPCRAGGAEASPRRSVGPAPRRDRASRTTIVCIAT